MNKQQAFKIFMSAPEVAGHHPNISGLVKCAKCGKYFSMYRNHITVEQGLQIRGIIQCECGQWHIFVD